MLLPQIICPGGELISPLSALFVGGLLNVDVNKRCVDHKCPLALVSGHLCYDEMGNREMKMSLKVDCSIATPADSTL